MRNIFDQRVVNAYVITIEAIDESRIYTPEGLFSFFKRDPEVMAKVATKATQEGEMAIATTFMGGRVIVTRILAIEGFTNGGTAYTVYAPRAQLEYRT